jgi:hypothetical protein
VTEPRSAYAPSRIETALDAAWCKPSDCRRACDGFCEKAWDTVNTYAPSPSGDSSVRFVSDGSYCPSREVALAGLADAREHYDAASQSRDEWACGCTLPAHGRGEPGCRYASEQSHDGGEPRG